MLINQANLGRFFTGISTVFNRGVGMVKPQWDRVAMRVPSTTKEESYGWLGKIPSIREWIGDRVVNGLSAHDYKIKNKSWESTIGVDRDDIEDDTFGVYSPLFEELGQSIGAFPNQLVFALLKLGFSELCYDGQFFFDTDHPVIDADGQTVNSVANTDGGGGTPWFLIDPSHALKPILYQVRKEFKLVRKDREEDDNVFERREFVYGIDGRMNVGFGLWQFAWGSKQTLSKANYKIGREGMMSFKGDHGRPIGAMPSLLVVPPSLEGTALEIVNSERDASGATNVYNKTAELVVVPWLA